MAKVPLPTQLPFASSRRYSAPMMEPRNEFERISHASEAAEASRLPSPRHRRLVWCLGLVCLFLWAALFFLLWRDGLGSSAVLPLVMATVNTVLFLGFFVRVREAERAHREGRPVRYRRGR